MRPPVIAGFCEPFPAMFNSMLETVCRDCFTAFARVLYTGGSI
jgi:hypothetical protein